MAYADDQELTTRKAVSIGLVVLLHIGAGYALITGLAYDATQAVIEDLKTFNVEEEKPPEPEEPPPPPEKLDIPPPPKVTVPPPVNVSPVISTNTQPVFQVTETAKVAEPVKEVVKEVAKPKVATRAVKRSGAISDDDYPPSSIRNEESGTARARFTIGTDGKVTSCSASGASPTLDALTCTLIQRRFKYKPALDENGSPIAESLSQSVTWRLPK